MTPVGMLREFPAAVAPRGRHHNRNICKHTPKTHHKIQRLSFFHSLFVSSTKKAIMFDDCILKEN